QFTPPPTGQFPAPGQPPGPPAETVAQPGRPVNLTKGQRISLQKQDGSQLTLVRMGLGWDPIKKRGLFGSREQEGDPAPPAVLFPAPRPCCSPPPSPSTSRSSTPCAATTARSCIPATTARAPATETTNRSWW